MVPVRIKAFAAKDTPSKYGQGVRSTVDKPVVRDGCSERFSGFGRLETAKIIKPAVNAACATKAARQVPASAAKPALRNGRTKLTGTVVDHKAKAIVRCLPVVIRIKIVIAATEDRT
jgi:hypothetical protein